MLIKRSVFEKMEKQYPELECVNDHQNRDLDRYNACLDCMIDPVRNGTSQKTMLFVGVGK
jgi:hypothetical protein